MKPESYLDPERCQCAGERRREQQRQEYYTKNFSTDTCLIHMSNNLIVF
jgi:hypothetical protein